MDTEVQPEEPQVPPIAEEKQCRICLDGPDESLGRLIRPCLCKGSMSYVHVGCLKRWRDSAASRNFFACPVCHYKYRLGRTKVVGIATNPVVVGALSSIFFTILVLCASFITTYFMSAFEDPSDSYYHSYYMNPIDITSDLIRAAIRIMNDRSGLILDDGPNYTRSKVKINVEPVAPGIIGTFIKRFILGLPMVGAVSVVQLLLSMPLVGPIHWIARFRGSRSRSRNERDIAALVVVLVILVGAARALWKVYNFTSIQTQRLLLRAEDAILEVN